MLLSLLLACSSARVIVPAYFDPEAGDLTWGALIDGRRAPALIIANPANGPGVTRSDAYYDGILQLQSQGIGVLGYVPSGYGEREEILVSNEMDAWDEGYLPNGIFLDEVAGEDTCEEKGAFYDHLASHLQTRVPGAFLALNPGASTCASLAKQADLTIVFEGSAAEFEAWEAPSWASSVEPGALGVLVYEASAAQAQSVLARVESEGVGWYYATNDTLPNPWDGLPSYWGEELRGF